MNIQEKAVLPLPMRKVLYFINPRGEEKDKPTQIWTQGETEATSVWCPPLTSQIKKLPRKQ